MLRLDLNGTWKARQKGKTSAVKATVPGTIHTDLLDSKSIPDPYYRDNETSLMWIGETDWIYERSFDADRDLLNSPNVRLVCSGLDTFATVSVNGKVVGKADNQFRTWEFDVKDALKAGANTISVLFTSPLPYGRKRQKERYLHLWGIGHHRISGGNYVRKSQCNYGWDWGPMCVTCGIWRDIAIIGYGEGRISDVHIRQDHGSRGKVQLNAKISVEKARGASLRAVVTVSLDGKTVASETADFAGKNADVRLTVKDPELWWPNGMGKQPLYDVTVELMGAAGAVDSSVTRIGLRTLTLRTEKDQWGQSFEFVANGKPFFAKGANWIPADTFVTRITDGQYEDLIRASAEANMNMLRVWGGGIYESDLFYELCDRYGICVWQDFMFACSAYPAFDQDFMTSVRVEVEDNVRRLRHHPSIAFWCGNNEIEQGFGDLIGDDTKAGAMTFAEYRSLFDSLIPKTVAKLDPDRRYWPCSPHSPVGDRKDFNNPTCGDAHLWSVWHGRKPFEWYRTCEHRFNSEFGFQSFPEPKVVEGYTAPEDRNITSFIMEKHQRSGIGNDAIIQYMLEWFKLPTSHDMILWTSQILQGMAIKYAVEHWRRAMPRGMGTLYWQINDCWPVASWSSIDYFHNWKALHFMARDFFAPVLISAVEDPASGNVDVHVTSDDLSAKEGTYEWTLTTASGKPVAKGKKSVKIPAQKSQKTETLKLKKQLDEYGPRNLILWLELKVDKKTVSTNMVTFVRPKHLELAGPSFTTVIKKRTDGDFALTVKSDKPALWVWPDLEGVQARYSERFFHLPAGKSVTLTVKPERELSIEDFKKRLAVNSIVDTYK